MRAIIEWLTKDQGGRTSLPTGVGSPPYAPVVRFNDEPWPAPVAWSLIVEKIEALSDPYVWVADVRFLVAEAPHNSLRESREFELYEGRRLVARGKIAIKPSNSLLSPNLVGILESSK